jgi:YHS domain-containing protein
MKYQRAAKDSSTSASAIDPLCAMKVNRATSRRVHDLNATRYFFCGEKCLTDDALWAGTSPGRNREGTGTDAAVKKPGRDPGEWGLVQNRESATMSSISVIANALRPRRAEL